MHYIGHPDYKTGWQNQETQKSGQTREMQYIGQLVVQGRGSQTRHPDYKTGWQSQLVGQEGKGRLRYLQKHLSCLVCFLPFLSHSCFTYFLTSFCLLKHLKESGGCLVYGSLCCLEICWKGHGGFCWWLICTCVLSLMCTGLVICCGCTEGWLDVGRFSKTS